MRRRSFFKFVAFALFIVGLVAGSLFGAPAALARSAEYTNFDVNLTVLDDGSFRIVETQTVGFTDGPFTQGHRTIPLARMSGVENIAVSEIVDGDIVRFSESDSGEYDTFEVIRSSTEVEIRWTFPPASDETRVFVVEYELVGALRYYPDADPPNQQVWYVPVGSALSSETPIQSGSITIDYPDTVAADRVVIMVDNQQIEDVSSTTADYQRFEFTHDAFESGESWDVRIQTDVVALDAEVPAWQAADDERRQREEEQAARDTQVAGFAGIAAFALAIFGGLSIFLLWFLRGRDPHTGVVASFLPEPPDSTPPAIVGVLIDERAQQRDIVSTFTDWGQRGIIAIHEPTGNVPTLELKAAPADLSVFEKQLLEIIFPSGVGQIVPFATARGALNTHEHALERTLYQEVEQRGLFRKSPEAIRNRWQVIAIVITSISIVGGILGSQFISWWILLPALTVTALSIVLRLTARTMPQRSAAGAEANAKWRAFERYLRDLETYDSLDTAKANYERYLPYAIAFGIESQWIERFNSAGYAPIPTWYDNTDFGEAMGRIPRGRVGRGRPVIVTTGGGSGGDGGGFDLPGLPDFDLPDLQDTSRKAAQGIGGASKGTVDVLNVIGAIFEVVSIFAGGGGKGGGSGGGGGGFN